MTPSSQSTRIRIKRPPRPIYIARSSICRLCEKPAQRPCRSHRYGHVTIIRGTGAGTIRLQAPATAVGMILPARKSGLLLDFLGLASKYRLRGPAVPAARFRFRRFDTHEGADEDDQVGQAG